MNVSVIIPTFNRAYCINNAVDSVLAQVSSGDTIVVVDDGSSDVTKEILSSYGDRIQYRCLEKNGGVSSARNLGFQEVEGALTVFLDADDVLTPPRLAMDRGFFGRNASVDALVHDAISFKGGQLHRSSWHSSKDIERTYGMDRTIERYVFDSAHRSVFATGSMTFRTSFLQQFAPGLFDIAFLYEEDWEFELRIMSRARIYISPSLGSVVRRFADGHHDEHFESWTPSAQRIERENAELLMIVSRLRNASYACAYDSDELQRFYERVETCVAQGVLEGMPYLHQ